MSERPVVSVCIPAFNAERFIREAVLSALSQQGPEIEVVVFDDASTDNTLAVLGDIRDSRLRVLRQTHTLGISQNRNSCIDAAQGEYLAWLDADDVLCNGALARGVAALERAPSAGLVHGGHHVMGDDGRPLPQWPQAFSVDTLEPGGNAFAELLLGNYVTASTVLVRRSCYRDVGGYEPALTRSGEDWEMWMRIALRRDLAYVATPLARYRRHGGSATAAAAGTRESVRRDRVAVDFALRHHAATGSGSSALLRDRAYYALAAKALLVGGRFHALGARAQAVVSTVAAARLAPSLARNREIWALAAAQARGDDYAAFRHGQSSLARIHEKLAGSRFAHSIEKLAIPNSVWENELASVASVVRRLVPRSARVAAVDKHDPTLLHLARRRGWHVPDLQLLPSGYPRDGAEAVAHLEALRVRGASHLVVPNHAFWWLEHYPELRTHLDACRALWSDGRCRIYELARPAA
jgi:GT2 family glycosyltransferase